MKTIIFLFITAVCCCNTVSGKLPFTNGKVIPQPVSLKNDGNFYFNPTKVNIKTSQTPVKSVKLGLRLLNQKLKSMPVNDKGGAISVTIAREGDPVWRGSEFSDFKGLTAQSYRIKCIENNNGLKILAVGSDNKGVFYAIASIIQLMYARDRLAIISKVDITDHPVWKNRIIGAYSPTILKNYEQLPIYKINGYGIQHRYDWKKFSPNMKPAYFKRKTYQQCFDDIRKFRNENGDLVDFMIMINIYSKSKQVFDISNKKDIQKLTDKCLWAAKYVQRIMIQVDDFTPKSAGKYVLRHKGEKAKFKDPGDAHGYLMQTVSDAVKKKFPGIKFSFCPAPYWLRSATTNENKKYMKNLGKRLPGDIPIAWTGYNVISKKINKDTHSRYSKLAGGHNLMLWDNSSHPTPLEVWNTSLFPDMEKLDNSTVYINSHAFSFTWSWVFCVNANDYLWNPSAYESKRSIDQAFYSIKGKRLPEFIQQTREDLIRLKQTWKRSEKATLARKILDREKLFNKKKVSFRQIKGIALKAYREGIIKTASTTAKSLDDDIDLSSLKGWESIPEIELNGNDKKNKYPTTVKVAYSKTSLYVLFDCKYSAKPEPKKLIKMKRDSSLKNVPDYIIIGLQPPMRSQRAGWIRVGIAGSIYDNKEWQPVQNFNPDIKVSRRLYDDNWQLIVKIPFAELKNHLTYKNVKKNDVWRVNFLRVNNIDHETSSWSPVEGNKITNKKYFGKLKFN